MVSNRRRRSGPRIARGARRSLGREDWIAAARDALIRAGINAVKVVALARRLRVTRGSFYWHFTSHADLLSELLTDWERTNTEPFERALSTGNSPHGVQEFLTVINLWVEEQDYSPAFDTAMRDWARNSRDAAAAVRRADERRIAVLHRIFIGMGYVDPEALVRARVTYFHQVGYYTLQLPEDRAQRRALVPVYAQVLAGACHELIKRAFLPVSPGAPATAADGATVPATNSRPAGASRGPKSRATKARFDRSRTSRRI
jgi:AcrR family transcriptional regulator